MGRAQRIKRAQDAKLRLRVIHWTKWVSRIAFALVFLVGMLAASLLWVIFWLSGACNCG